MNNRIKLVRKHARLTQTEFGERLGVKGNTITGYEGGTRAPSDAVIRAICREFNVNEAWLRTGEEPMFLPQNRHDEIAAFMRDITYLEDDDFKVRLISVLSRLDAEGWKLLEQMAQELRDK